MMRTSRGLSLSLFTGSSCRSGHDLVLVRGLHVLPRRVELGQSSSRNNNQHEYGSRPYIFSRFNRSFTLSSIRYTSTKSPNASSRMEEETLYQYKADNYLPIRIGQVMQDRYLIISKLGFGTSSTVWLVQDHHTSEYYALKACTRDAVSKEIEVSDRIHAINAEHPGIARLRVVMDKFMFEGPGGQHQCLVFKPCGMSFMRFMNLMPDRVLGKTMLQQTLLSVFMAVDVLHQIGIVHTDLSPNNILLGADDQSTFAEMRQAEAEQPCVQKLDENRVIYQSQQMPVTTALPMIVDFGAAAIGEPGQKHTGDVMPNFYRAPEIILGMSWDDKIDIWSIGTMTWDLFEQKRLFNAMSNKQLDDEQHLAEMVALLGSPPKKFLERSAKCKQYWDAEGNWIAKTPIPDKSFESMETRLEGEDKMLLLAFVRKLLRWLPEERATASDMFEEPFLGQWHEAKHREQE